MPGEADSAETNGRSEAVGPIGARGEVMLAGNPEEGHPEPDDEEATYAQR